MVIVVLHITKQKEDIHISYISALCASAGIAYEIRRHDEDGVDGILHKCIYLDGNKKYNAELNIQLKATSSPSQYTDNGDTITYKLKVKNYNDLCGEGTVSKILGLLILPEESDEWVSWSQEELMIKGCMYWAEFFGETESMNTGSVSVKIDKKNVINAETLQEILEKIAREEWP